MFNFFRGKGTPAAYAFWCGYCLCGALKSLLAAHGLMAAYYAVAGSVYWFWFKKQRVKA